MTAVEFLLRVLYIITLIGLLGASYVVIIEFLETFKPQEIDAFSNKPIKKTHYIGLVFMFVISFIIGLLF